MFKKYILFKVIAFFVVLQLNAGAQILNGNFTNWATDSLGRLDPTGWISSNLLYHIPTVLQDTDRTGGAGFSAKFVAAYDSSQGFYEGGMLSYVNQPFTGVNRPTDISGYWKLFDPFSTDGIIVELKMYNSSNVQIGSADAGTNFTGSIPNWTFFTSPVTYTANDPIDNYSLNLIFFDLANDSTIYAHLDDLTFDFNNSIGEPDPSLSSNMRYLNHGVYNLEVNNQKGYLNVELFDLTGKMIKNIFKGNYQSGINNYEIDLSSFDAGIYLCRISNGIADQSMKLVKE